MKSIKPQRLIYEENGIYYCDTLGLDVIRQINNPLGVIAVTGRYRGGKSFLTNRAILSLGPRQGFQTSSSVNACTKGIWVTPGFIKNGVPTAVVLDTEGSGSLDASPQQDAKLLSIAVALSSILVFNSLGALDEGNFAEISILAHAAKNLQATSDEYWTPPELFWTLRDFALELKTQDGESMTPNQYLETCLNDEDRGETRTILKKYFSTRFLIPFVRPVNDELKLQRLNSLSDKELRPAFCQNIQEFRSLIQERLKPKKVGECHIHGEGLVHLCQTAVSAVNEGKVPSVRNTFSFMLASELKQAIDEGKRTIKEEAIQMNNLVPCAPEMLRLSPPEIPPALEAYEDIKTEFRETLDNALICELEILRNRNSVEQKKWIREYIQVSSSLSSAYAFTDYLEVAPRKLGDKLALETIRLIHDSTSEGIQAEFNEYRKEKETSDKRLTSFEEECSYNKSECNQLREELEQALLNYNSTLPDPGKIENDEATSNYEHIVKALEECTLERDEETRRNLELRTELIEVHMKAEQKQPEVTLAQEKRNMILTEELDHSKEECSTLIRSLREDLEQNEVFRLDQLKAEMMKEIDAGKKRTFIMKQETTEHAERLMSEIHDLNDLCQRRVESENELRNSLNNSQSEYSMAIVDFENRIQECKKRQTEMLAESAKKMRTSHEEASNEISRLHQQALENDRFRIRLEVENQSLKRGADSHKDDLINLTKARRNAEDLRELVYEKDAELRVAEASIRDYRLRLNNQEAQLREQHQINMSQCRDKDYRIAFLEVQLSSQSQIQT